MSNQHRRHYETLIQDELAAQGLGPATFEIRGSGHQCAMFRDRTGRLRKVFYSNTPTDKRAAKNTVSLVRRLARGDATIYNEGLRA